MHIQGTALASNRRGSASRPLSYGRASFLIRQTEKRGYSFKHEGRTVVAHGTGATIAKMVSKPLARLIEHKEIGPEEIQAASDIFTAFMSMTGNLWIGPQSWERRDRSHNPNEAAAVIDAQARYKAWAAHWSMLAKRGDKTMQIVISAVVDERPFYQIEQDIGLRHGKARKATIRGLRDYAARAGWVRGHTAAQWKAEAGATFKTVHPLLSLAIAAGRALTAGRK